MKRLRIWNILMLVVMALSLMTACGSDGGGDGKGGGGGSSSGSGWYASDLPTSFTVTYESVGYYKDYVLEHIDELFLSDGRYGGEIHLPDGMVYHGPAYCHDDIEVIHLANNTLENYKAYLYKYGASGTVGKTLIYRVTGSSLGDVAFYASSPKYYNYTQEGNVIKLTIKNTTTSFVLTGDGIMIDGEKWTKFNFGQTFVDSNGGGSDSSSDIADARTISKTASVVGTPTFHTATFRCSFGTSTKGKSYEKVFAFSKNKSDLESPDLLASRYHKLGGVLTTHIPPTYAKELNAIYGNDNGSSYLEDGDLRFANEQISDLTNFTAAYDELNVTIYYCPMLMVGSTAVTGDIKSVSLRQLKQTFGFVDLGLSCLWSATNNKASSPWDLGSSITLLNKNVSGDGRLPTKDEVLELNKCQLETVDNGVLVKGLNGNEIFIPFRTTQTSSIYPGYGTSSTQTSGSSNYDVLFRFDSSSNKFTTAKASEPYNIGQYTMHTSAYVRPVKDGGSSGGSGSGGSGGSSGGGSGGSSSSTKHYLYGENPVAQPPFVVSAWDAAAMRFSNTDGMYFPTISDYVYYTLKTLIFDVSDVSSDFDLKVMNGWWTNTYYDHVKWVDGKNEIKITETMALECAKTGEGRDLDLMLYSGTCTIKSVYYEE